MMIFSNAGTSFVDRLSSRYTVIILLCLSVVLLQKQYGGQPIECWCPAQFASSHRSYSNSVCWATSIFYSPEIVDHLQGQPLPRLDANSSESRDGPFIAYYQWTPLMLMCAAAVFTVPSVLWGLANHVATASIVDVGKRCEMYARVSDIGERKKMMTCTAATINETFRRRSTNSFLRCLLVVCSVTLTIGYMFIKLMHLLVAGGLLILLDMFLGKNSVPSFYGIKVLARIIKYYPWGTSPQFPLVALCGFDIRHQSRVHSYVIQCYFPINLFNEAIAIFLWVWFLSLGVAAFFSLLRWFVILFLRPCYVGTRLRAMMKYHDPSLSAREVDKLAMLFLYDGLSADTYLAIRLVAHNCGDSTASDLIFALWQEQQTYENGGTSPPGDNTVADREPKQIGSPHLQYTTAKDGGSTARRRAVEPKESNLEQLWVARNSQDDIANAPSLTDLYPTLNMNLNM